MIVKKMPILQGFPDFETVKFFTGKFFQKYNFSPVFYDIETTGLSRETRIYTWSELLELKIKLGLFINGWPKMTRKKKQF